MSSARRGSSRAARREAALDRLLPAAARLLGDGGSFRDLSVERLAVEAEISRASFYIYFEDKAELLRAWFSRNEDAARAATEGWWGSDGPVTREQIRDALAALSRLHRDRALVAAFQELAYTDDALRELQAVASARTFEGLHAHVRRGQEEGWVDPTLLPRETSAWLASMLGRMTREVVPRADDTDLEPLLDAGAEVVWTTLYAPAAAPAD
jgi:AcrR family transcriptional regulator